jgi:hypothetical protein
MKINDKEWLDKVYLGYKIYSEEVAEDRGVEDFIKWLYAQYGIVYSDKSIDQFKKIA